MSEPRTDAGKALLACEAYNSRSFALITAEAILAIEAEARADAIRDAATAVERLAPCLLHSTEDPAWPDKHLHRSFVLAAIRALGERP